MKQFTKTIIGIVLIAALFFALAVVLNFAQGTL